MTLFLAFFGVIPRYWGVPLSGVLGKRYVVAFVNTLPNWGHIWTRVDQNGPKRGPRKGQKPGFLDPKNQISGDPEISRDPGNPKTQILMIFGDSLKSSVITSTEYGTSLS